MSEVAVYGRIVWMMSVKMEAKWEDKSKEKCDIFPLALSLKFE